MQKRISAGGGNTPAYAGKTGSGRRSSLAAQKHPRLRGEDLTPAATPAPLQETPPLTRGRLQDDLQVKTRIGNTPAYAGKTRKRLGSRGRSRKHPRLRGEDEFLRHRQRDVVETPPLTRGRLEYETDGVIESRNTPAHAGKTNPFVCRKAWHWKHPRLRGEDRRTRNLLFRLLETPPLTRGRLDRSPCIGFSPEKHPRLRGEDVIESPEVTEKKETPPLTRGRLSFGCLPCRSCKKHPRLRGEDLTRGRIFSSLSETPPLTRGRLALVLQRISAPGNTPAYAGKTCTLYQGDVKN